MLRLYTVFDTSSASLSANFEHKQSDTLRLGEFTESGSYARLPSLIPSSQAQASNSGKPKSPEFSEACHLPLVIFT